MPGAGLILAGLLAAPTGDVGVRIRESAAAAQALQGPLDGAWRLTDLANRALFDFQIVDPAANGGLEGAWRDAAGATGALHLDRRGGRLRLSFTDGGVPYRVTLKPVVADGWAGKMRGPGGPRGVRLRRDAARLAARPPPV